ncbi:NEDD8-conjugating protein ubc12 [Mucor velutinosus]|uniref:Kinetochore protein Spc24 n=1 Tax=Mucor velutinosus TaxID=708070 RepID=A0AAN7D855_9FUNG|nr:NEDD8-conjugating protein ubc12 [Mucor velutinosus]
MQTDELHLKAIDKSLWRNPIDMLQEVQRLQAEKEIEQQKILEATQKEIEDPELQKEADALAIEEAKVRREYEAALQENALREQALQEQDALEQIELAKMAKMQAEIDAMEEELRELESNDPSKASITTDELRLGLYTGLGVKADIRNDKPVGVVLTSANRQDLRVMRLDQYDADYLSNQIWEFIS